MRYRTLGDSDLQVSEISLGSWLTYSGGVEREQTVACTAAAFDVGITFFDTANAYGRGAAETVWGEILKDYARDSYVLATKVFFDMSDTDGGLSAQQIHKQCDASLARLQTDYVDLYQCHRFDVTVPIEETLEALGELVAAGKVRHLGFSEWTPEQIRAALAVPGAPKFISSQPQYSMLWRAPEEEIFPLCAEHGIGQVVWSPLAEGVLTGKYKPGVPPPAGTRATSAEMSTFIRRHLTDETLEAVQRLEPIAAGAGLTMAQLALAWVLRRPEVASAIIGATRPEQVHDNAAASGVTLSDDVLAAIDEALDDVPVTGTQLAPGASAGVLHR
ncbi:MAG: aldo/keto reductase [Solirubrobacterales bacterium]|nr:aldo/keto reductase [Solirubrobacterales bacterium]